MTMQPAYMLASCASCLLPCGMAIRLLALSSAGKATPFSLCCKQKKYACHSPMSQPNKLGLSGWGLLYNPLHSMYEVRHYD